MSTSVAEAQPKPSPERFFETVNAYQRCAAMKAAIELGLFTAISEGATRVFSLAQRCAASERGVRILCDYLTIIGFLNKQAGEYSLTPDSAAFLARSSPVYLGNAVEFLLSPMLMDPYRDLTQIVRSGRIAEDTNGTLAPEHPLWVRFAKSMVGLVAGAAQWMAEEFSGDGQRIKVLDIAAGHGLFGVWFAKTNPNAEIVAQDWPNVLSVAMEHAEQYGVAGRYRLLPGSAFEVDFGGGYDVVLLTNFLHHFDIPTNEGLLGKVNAALKPGGRVIALEFVPNEDRVSPPTAAAFSMMMLGSTPNGDAYTLRQIDSMFRNAGFGRCEAHQPPNSIETVLVARK